MESVQKKQSLVERDRQNVWHHISPYSEKNPPMVVEEGKGSWITDHQGKQYLDGMSGLFCVNVGYGREELAQAAYEQIKKMAYVPMTQSHGPAIELAEKVNEMLGGDYVIFYSNSGSDANEVAFKMARQYHQQKGEGTRYKVISRYRAYHGSSAGALSATGQALRKYKYEPLTSGFLHVAPPDNYRKPEGMSIEDYNIARARELEETIIWEQKETIAAVIMEPLITGGGVLVPDPVYVEKVQEVCNRHGVLLIIDEVICGFGRTGKAFGHQHFNIKPDMVTMAKGLTSAYLPLSITAVRKDIYEKFKDGKENSHFRHVNTFGGNPAACALALKNIEIMEKENLFNRSAEAGNRLLNGLDDLRNLDFVGDIRGLGLIIGIEIVEDKLTKKPASPECVGGLIAACKANGLIIGKNGDTVAGHNNILTLSPPLSSTDDDFDFMINVLKKVFHEKVN
ncbi:putative aminotransferase YhxA [Oceanobacillus oncorhynchi subsp. incaldanensis]|uniref:Taurine--pyruvate aminotransferase n=1 Tax=Oceanobacillus oncorhynchi TaxID=545501 RepID=A0A0A1MAN7_9BACI|nr:aspartate aminotransferase family protein [Oceanobacillus oncorhynchi]UUI40960.1 aspartate aminotransferase family protein [Oceanobacillus oncorhynchi]GIO18833.1 putative aminotransferase YhxA [Oceanobacillus oncorhynchi subsp. incaldanensis]CEI82405.1 Taurine--pyruvate aminotransferase [Oceanobacillus oncorhynchi]